MAIVPFPFRSPRRLGAARPRRRANRCAPRACARPPRAALPCLVATRAGGLEPREEQRQLALEERVVRVQVLDAAPRRGGSVPHERRPALQQRARRGERLQARAPEAVPVLGRDAEAIAPLARAASAL